MSTNVAFVVIKLDSSKGSTLLQQKFSDQIKGRLVWLQNRTKFNRKFIPIEFSNDKYYIANYCAACSIMYDEVDFRKILSYELIGEWRNFLLEIIRVMPNIFSHPLFCEFVIDEEFNEIVNEYNQVEKRRQEERMLDMSIWRDNFDVSSLNNVFVVSGVDHFQMGGALGYANEETLSNREQVLKAVKSKGSALGYAACQFRSDREIVMEALKNDYLAMQYTDESLRNDRDFLLECIKYNEKVLWMTPLKEDRDFVFQAVSLNGKALEDATKFQKDYEMVKVAVQQNGSALNCADDSLKYNHELLVEAVKSVGFYFSYSKELYNIRMNHAYFGAKITITPHITKLKKE